jgi:hypothetical protein
LNLEYSDIRVTFDISIYWEGEGRMATKVECARHGACKGCMICRHLREGQGLGYWRVKVPPSSDDYETGMCEECDAFFWREQGWTDQLFEFAGWKLFCRKCYAEVLDRHRLVGIGKLGDGQE